jgi:hypothetical protein
MVCACVRQIIACRICGFCFQFAACYEAHLPSVTVRDENAQALLQHVCSCRTPTDKTVWPAWDDDDAMHRDVCRQSERRNTVQRDGGHLPKLQPHLETNHVRMKRLFRNACKCCSSAVQCCSGMCTSPKHHGQLRSALTDGQLPHRIAVKVL